MTKNETIKFAQDIVSDKLKKEGFVFVNRGNDFFINQKSINVRGCNRDNAYAKKKNLVGGWGKLKPDNFDFFIFVSFDENFKNEKNERCFVLTSKEVQQLPDDPKAGGGKNLDLVRNNRDSDDIIKRSEEKWNKLPRAALGEFINL